MGNTPTQQPSEEEDSRGEARTAGASLSGRLLGAARSVLDGLRSRLSVFSTLDLGTAFGDTERDAGTDGSRTAGDPRTTELTRETTGVDNEDESDSTTEFPARDRPLTEPARDTTTENPPDLESELRDGTLSIYYPGRSEATLESDTWERIEP